MTLSLTCCWSWNEMWWDHGRAEINVSVQVTHTLLVMGWDVMRLHGRIKCSVSLTCYWSWDVMRLKGSWNKIVTYILLVIGWDMMRLHGCQFHSQAVGHGMSWDEAALWNKMAAFTHSLLIIWWDMTNMHCRKRSNTTHFLLVMGWYVTILLVM